MVPSHSLSSASLKSLFILSLSTLSPLLAQAHSWLDCSDTRDNGACFGYPLGYPSRNDRDINTKYTYLVQNRRPDAPVCQPGRQNIPGNNPFQPASVMPGQSLHLTWQPDGHLDDAKPSFVEIHWSGVAGKQIWTRSELGDNTRLATMTFATSGNCDRPGEPNTWCHGRFTVPEWTQPGTYQMIWWWKYDRNPAGEEYSTCFEINVGWNAAAAAAALCQRSQEAPQVSQAQVEAQVQPQPQPQVQSQPPQQRQDSPAAAVLPPSDAVVIQSLTIKSLAYDDPTLQPAAVAADASGPVSLADMVAQADAPLAGIPSPDYHASQSTEGYQGDDDGLLAVDAINMDSQTVPPYNPIDLPPSNMPGPGMQQDQRAPPPQSHNANDTIGNNSSNTTSTSTTNTTTTTTPSSNATSSSSPSSSPSSSTSSHPHQPSSTGNNTRTLVGTQPKGLPAPYLASSAVVEMGQISWALLLASTMAFMAFLMS
ncbi:hypothetical protein DFQ27_004440 [Actinomortierella ambigua]|uniref:Lytic polysaccharide monooxygenase n=1 Tax=Actinomortierella ambigua TaxID=1343610 RepID=A0A9P6UCK1_9FUNG|nr:hypothetical protein DFQ27_004440 [Actinomortierella ambigua]